MTTPPAWVDHLCEIPRARKTGGASILALFQRAAPPLNDPDAAGLVRQRLSEDPSLVDAWQTYSYDKRTRQGPYLDGREVGYFDGDRRDVSRHADILDACTGFILRDARSVLEGPR